MTSMLPLSSLDPAAFPIPDSDQALTDEITRLAGHINAAQYRFLKLLAVLIERNAWGGDSGIKSPAHWLNYYCGIDLGAAREKVRVARALQTLPQIDQAFASGAISYSKVRAMTRSATADNEAVLLNVARYGTAQHVETLVRHHRRVQRLQRDAGNGNQTQHEARELTWYFDEDGMLVLKGRFAPEEGAVLMKALEAALDTLAQDKAEEREQEKAQDRAQEKAATASEECLDDDSTEQVKNVSAETFLPADAESTFPRKRADAMLMLGEHFLATRQQGTQSLAIADKYQVLIHLDACSGRATGLIGPSARLDEGPPLSEATCKRLACDASLVPVLRDDTGNVLNIGRKTRAVPPAMRRALKIRDGGCRHPSCTQTRYVDAHHIQHWCDGGETSLDNLVLLCRYHHRQLHEDAFSMEKTGGRKNALRFLDSRGREIKPTLWPQFDAPACARDGRLVIEQEHARLGLMIDAGTAVTKWQGERMDYDIALGGM